MPGPAISNIHCMFPKLSALRLSQKAKCLVKAVKLILVKCAKSVFLLTQVFLVVLMSYFSFYMFSSMKTTVCTDSERMT